jgi:L-threonylcarbamoyladenylate synthase
VWISMSSEENSLHWPTDAEIKQAVEILRRGGLVAFPTETVYGLGADARNQAAIERIFAAKNRPRSHPLIVHLADASWLPDWVGSIPEAASRLAENFWPGPLTLILPKQPEVLDTLTGGSEALGIRIPGHPVAQRLLQEFGSGIAAPSANQFKRVSPTLAKHVRRDLGSSVDLVLDGGACKVGIESTIVDFSQEPPVILRLGQVTQANLEQVAGGSFSLVNRRQTSSPGQHPVHYSPRAKTIIADVGDLQRLAQQHASEGHRVVILSRSEPPSRIDGFTWWQLPDQMDSLAQVLYQRMHEVDEQGFSVLLMDLPPDEGIGSAIRDRIFRAAGTEGREAS